MAKFITETDLLKAQADARKYEETFKGCRQKEKAFNARLWENLEKSKARTSGKIKYIIYRESKNLGTKKYGDWFKQVMYCGIGTEIKETEKSYIVYMRYNKHVFDKNSIFFVKEEK